MPRAGKRTDALVYGNLFEWCHDWYGEEGDDAVAAVDLLGALAGTGRVFRGGGWEG
jgi:formylglycine-generating enzyme required for sulfatase activity